ncbi:uncharacterized protein [Miscanthus floridulus]|uniref:uncharacterized protein isoform X3 n=1 Tax=Miscanthus floridulus TaxID=154761 RepID=UPI00345A9C5E
MLMSTVVLNVYFIYGWEWFGTGSKTEAKAVVSVTVEGSVGLVKAMVRLGASVGEAIASVVERYAREGRSPCLDPAAACSRDLPTSPLSFEPSESSCTAGFSSGDLVTALQCMHASICTTCKKCKGFREADGEPGSRTCSWAPMASPRPHSPSSITLRKSTKLCGWLLNVGMYILTTTIEIRSVQQIIDAILVLDIGDPPCAIAAGALLFVLASDMSTS